MEMKDIIKELEEKLEETKAQMDEWAAKEKFWKAAVEQAQKEIEVLQDNTSSLEMMIEAAKEGHFGLNGNKADKPKEPKKETAKKAVTDDTNHRGKRVGVYKLNEYDNIEDRWKSQKEAAKALGMDQSDLSKFMRLSKDVQISKRGFALAWEY